MGKNDENEAQVSEMSSISLDLPTLKTQRSTMKRNISKLKNKVEKEGSSSDYTIIKCRLQILESYFVHISHIQTQIERLDPLDESRSDLEELFIQAKAMMVDLLDKKRRSSENEHSFLNSTSTFTHQNRLPQIKLPKFDGKYAEYSRFISTFNTLVHEESFIPTIDKFNYLLNCLSGQALAVVEPFQVIDENYQKALDRLKERYDNKALIFIDHINSLFSISAINKPNATELRSILDNVAALRSSLLSLGSESDVMNAIIIHLVLSKVDSDSKAAYDQKQDYKKLPSWDDCYSILSRRCQFLESRISEKESFTHREPNQRPKFKHHASSFATFNTLCEYCQSQEHFIGSCNSYLSLPIPRRFEFVKNNKLCINCLRKGHMVSKCSSKSRCRTCNISHHTTLHNPEHFSSQHRSNTSNHQHSSSNSSSAPTTSSFAQQSAVNQPLSLNPSTSSAAIHITTQSSLVTRAYRRSLLPTAIVFIKDSFGVLQPVRALLDSCSEINLITQETVNRLRLKQTKYCQEISGVEDIRTQLKNIITTTIKSRITDFQYTSTFFVTKSITSQKPSERFDIRNWNIPEGLELADPQFYLPQRVDLLLNADIFFDLLLVGKISLGEGLPCLQNSSLGWIVGGKMDSQPQNEVLSCNVMTTYQELDTMLKAFWEIEEFQQNKSLLTEEENQCEQHFMQNTVFDQNGRVKVRLPFKISFNHLGSSFETARRRFLYLEKRLLKDEVLRQMYVDFMNEYINLGHMSLVSSEVLSKPHYVIPHHSILRPQSTSTKLRVVFDASARTSTNISLNETLMIGPTIQQDLILTILSFRLHKFALSADICKMYRQFLVDERDRNFQLILWRNSSADPIGIYQLNTVTYGTSAAPFLAIRSLYFIAEAYKFEFPIGSKVLEQDLYVDDLLTGASTIFELSTKKAEVIQILEKAGLQLSKFNSNCQELAQSTEEMHLKTNNENITKALGMSWKPNQDLFCFRFELPTIEVPTKRSVLSIVARIFDVLGLLSPIVISCKILIQEMWKQQLDWDSPLNDRLKNRWLEIEKSLSYINQIEVPRFVQTTPDSMFDIHGFADASQLAYGCCIYVRVAKENGFKSTLLIAKSKVAPVVQQSLPRLELCAALLLSRTWDKIKHKFESYNYRIFFWSDSKIVLSWLTNHSSSFVCFVANRVSEIQNTSHNIPWRHVPSKENPADVVSRGCLAHELTSTIWFSGPEFLNKCDEDWPKSNISSVELPSGEMRKSSFKTFIVENSIISKIIVNQSSYLRILHIIVYVHRLFCKSKRNSFITSEELQLAFWKVIHDIQSTAFKEEIYRLQRGETLSASFQKLSPFLHEIPSYKSTLSILRVGGRLANSSLSYDTKFPALLPKDHRFTTLYIKYLHLKHLHAGPKALIGILRQQVWVINAREVVRKVVRNCVHCFRYKPQLMQQVMGDLPADRFKAQRPFLVCGVDFCGPFYTSYRIRGKPPYKTYVAIFVCFASKAIHIELVSDLSTNTFLLCLKRFIGRRGIPQRLYCDNATNFVGANSKLQDFKQKFFDDNNLKSLMHFGEVTGFRFSFIPPRSPHFGGLWESSVKSTKALLIKNMSQAGMTYEEFQTVLIEVEAILNSRPLTPRSDDPNDGEALTPAHMLIGSSLLALPDENLDRYKNTNYLKRWQLVTFLKQQFWIYWVRDYVLSLQQKSKWFKSCNNVEEGRLVIVHEDNLPPQQWLLARVVKAIPGGDGKIRVVDVKTSKGVFRRSIHKIAPLPTNEIDPSENDHDAENSDRSDDDDEENDEIADDGMVEKTFKFDDFAKRLLNPKIVRACVVVLTDWEQIPTKSLKAAVTILHRIAYGCSCPAMLYQAKLFRIFQQVFHAVRDAHHEELRRLGIYVVRKFVETAPNNPKIYAELLFYKSIREANELESGYCDAYESGTKGTWTEEQEAELRFLFEENQRNPETDKDVIDWILDNLIDKTRTRRGVLKKLKDMGLQFKAPTKKSTARAQNKNLWPTEEDEELRSLYDQYRIEDDCLQRILDEFGDRRNKQQIIKRMLQLHIIADKSEILPEKPKKRKSKKKGGDNNDDNDDEDEYMEEPTFGEQLPSTSGGNKPKKPIKAKQRKIVRTPLDVGTIRALIAQIDAEKYQEAIDWLKECLDDAADDTDEPSEEDDGVPLVPLQEVQKDAMEDDNFKKVLVALGIQPPVFAMESYWRIPTYLNSADLKLRAKIVGGEEVEIDVEDLEEDEGDDNSDNEAVKENAAYQDGEESEEDYLETLGIAKERNKLDNLENYMDQQREKLKSLMFSKSDEETKERAPLKANKKPKSKKERKSKKEKNDSDSEEDPDLVNKIKKKLDKKKRNMDLSSEEEEENDEEPGTFKKPKEKEVAKPNTGDLFDQLKAKRASSKMNLIDMVAEPKSSSKVEEAGNADDDNDFDFNSEDYRKRLAELGDDEDDVESGDEDEQEKDKQKTLTNRSRRANVIESDSDDDDVVDNVNKDGNNPDDDDDGVKTIRQQETGDSNDASDTLMKKRRRSDTEKSPEDEEVEEEKDSDEDAKFLTRKKPSPSKQTFAETGEEPAKRRRIAIIDDDDEDD